MRWYLNDASLQAQFEQPTDAVETLRSLFALRQRFGVLKASLYVTPALMDRLASYQLTVRDLLGHPSCRASKGLLLHWLGRGGPFVEDDRLQEADDYFEFQDMDVTYSGLGEAARRVKANQEAQAFSFAGGAVDFALTPLNVIHGIPEDRLGQFPVSNLWTIADLEAAAAAAAPPPGNWRALIEAARSRFPKLWLPDAIYLEPALSREAFDSVIADRTLSLLAILDRYMRSRRVDGSETPAAQSVIQEHFTGDRAVFSGESSTNRQRFKDELTFPDPASTDRRIFAHWHGKISHRFFRLHFEWPVPADSDRLKILYLGPKITKE